MDRYAIEKAKRLRGKGLGLTIKRAIAESLPFPDESFDAVVCTLTLCSVGNPEKALAEISRVLKRGGKFIFVEHVRSSDNFYLRLQQNLFNPLQTVFADGCNLNRDTATMIQRTPSFSSVDLDTFSVPDAYLISSHISGIATKASPN